MYKVNGWIEILTSTDGDEDFEYQHHVAEWVKVEVEGRGLSGFSKVLPLGGSWVLAVHTIQNRDRNVTESLEILIAEIGRRAPGSYGLIHFKDDDFERNHLMVLSLKRGIVEVVPDELLSPIVPTIEDP